MEYELIMKAGMRLKAEWWAGIISGVNSCPALLALDYLILFSKLLAVKLCPIIFLQQNYTQPAFFLYVKLQLLIGISSRSSVF